jgi:hypothetical protein
MYEKLFAWKPVKSNVILEADTFYISYNENTGDTYESKKLTDLANAFGANVKDGKETALVDTRGGRYVFHILEGDFRKEYEDVFLEGFEACLAVFNKNKKYKSNWSSV